MKSMKQFKDRHVHFFGTKITFRNSRPKREKKASKKIGAPSVMSINVLDTRAQKKKRDHWCKTA